MKIVPLHILAQDSDTLDCVEHWEVTFEQNLALQLAHQLMRISVCAHVSLARSWVDSAVLESRGNSKVYLLSTMDQLCLSLDKQGIFSDPFPTSSGGSRGADARFARIRTTPNY